MGRYLLEGPATFHIGFIGNSPDDMHGNTPGKLAAGK